MQRPRDGNDAFVVADVRDIVKGNYGGAHGLGLAHVDALDAGVGVRAGNQAGKQHARQADIHRVDFLAGDTRHAIFAAGDFSDNFGFVFFGHWIFPAIMANKAMRIYTPFFIWRK